MKMNALGNEKGFTLIELIVMIVIMGILAAIAVPKYQDLTTEASNAAAEGVLSAARGGAAINFSKNLAGGSETAVSNDTAGATRLVALIDTDIALAASATVGEVTATINGKSYVMEITTPENTTTAPTPAKIGKKTSNWPSS